ncbi:YpfB family protein [Bacillus sp. CGMCC 1.16607]|uniref:YpfB family protein n=1 Tax=Bacillus sp. CGMCC 1.16607 TaxID=3351842 RepID=UPI0036301435
MMKNFERILIKVIIVQFLFLIITQIVFHHFNAFPELKEIIQYEGVNNENYSEILETLGR